MFQGNGFGGVGGKASSGFGQWYTDMQDAKEVRDSNHLSMGADFSFEEKSETEVAAAEQQ